MCPTVALVESSVDNGTTARFVVVMVPPLATWTEGPEVVAQMLVQCGPAAVPVAPVSTMAV
jgi:hypothetical protein